MSKDVKGVIFAIAAIVILAIVVSGSGILPFSEELLTVPPTGNSNVRGESYGNSNAQAESYGTVQSGAANTSGNNQYRQQAEQVDDSIDLTSLSPYYEGNVQIERYGLTDTLGNRYKSGLRGYMAPGDTSKYNINCYSIWDIGGKYSTLTATGIIRKKDSGSKYEGSFKIYGDGRLLYSRDGIGSMTKPYQITIDISGVTDLKIEMYGNGNAGSYGINSVLADVTLHR